MSGVDIEISYNLPKPGDEAARPASLSCDPEKYRDEVESFDITEEQKHELLLTLWSIMRSFVELGFTVDVCAALSNDLTPIPGDEELR